VSIFHIFLPIPDRSQVIICQAYVSPIPSRMDWPNLTQPWHSIWRSLNLAKLSPFWIVYFEAYPWSA
jgi:hypothetical protein